ncbi:MAG: regulatory protein RecX [Candidatus Omnitrophica bacterium]|nr:regulatory protein RecX [Candidatus Omnitrophota bacterium]
MKKQPVKKPASLSKPAGDGLASNSQSHNAEKARAYAFLLLKFRLRSENELKARLKQKGFSTELAQATVNFLKDKKFIDDRVFARGWVSSRLKRPLGLRKIRQELMQKGLDKEVISEALAQAKECYNERQLVEQLAQQKFSKLKNIDPLKAKARVYGYLMRRGFSPDIISDVVKEL